MRSIALAAGWAWAAAIVWLSLTPRLPDIEVAYGDKLGHFAAYGLLMLWFASLYRHRNTRIWYAMAFIAMGVALEFIQGALGYRTYEVFDMYANTIGVLMGWGAALLLARIRAH